MPSREWAPDELECVRLNHMLEAVWCGGRERMWGKGTSARGPVSRHRKVTVVLWASGSSLVKCRSGTLTPVFYLLSARLGPASVFSPGVNPDS